MAFLSSFEAGPSSNGNHDLNMHNETSSLLTHNPRDNHPSRYVVVGDCNDRTFEKVDSNSLSDTCSDEDDDGVGVNETNDDVVPEPESITYMQLLIQNSNYRFFWLSYVANHMGEWLTYLASISLIQTVASQQTSPDGDDGGSRVNTMISILILVRLLPNVLFMPLGGVLADKYDRRKNQIAIDMASSLMVLLYLLSVRFQSIPILYLANFCQESLGGLYLPSNSAIVPLLTSSEAELEKATTLSSVTWSLVAALGSSLGGVLVAILGVRGCYVIDSMTYLISAALLTYGVRGTFMGAEAETAGGRQSSCIDATVAKGGRRESDGPSLQQPTQRSQSTTNGYALVGMEVENGTEKMDDHTTTIPDFAMFVEGLQFAFVIDPTVGAYALLKGTAALTYGATDLLNVAFSVLGSDDDPTRTSLKLGLLFACVGVGCVIGSLLCDRYASLSRPQQMVPFALSGFLLMSVGCLFMGLFPQHFVFVCLSATVRSAGANLVWICSTLLLQKYSPAAMLGRVESIDLSAGLFGEAASALGAGLLMDDLGVSPEGLSFLLSALAFGSFVVWNVLILLVLNPPTTALDGTSQSKDNAELNKAEA